MPSLRQLICAWSIFHLLIWSIADVKGEPKDELVELSCDEKDANSCSQFFHTKIASYCENGTCICKEPESNHLVTCKPIEVKRNNFVGGACPCNLNHTVCRETEGVCYCEKGYRPAEDLRSCIPKSVLLGGYCEEHSQCSYYGQAFTYCDENYNNCSCRRGYLPYEGFCLSRLGIECDDDSHCNGCGSAVCVSDYHRTREYRCACLFNFVRLLNHDSCGIKSSYNNSCFDHTLCMRALGDGSFCNGRSCLCRKGYYYAYKPEGFELPEEIAEKWDPAVNELCLEIPEYGNYCEDHSDCEMIGVPKEKQVMECIYGACNCVPGYKAYDNKYCVNEKDKPKDLNAANTKTIHLGMMILIINVSLVLLMHNLVTYFI